MKRFTSLIVLIFSVLTTLPPISQSFADVSTTPQPFSDVSQFTPYYTATLYLKNKEVISGYEDGTFKPTQKVNRAEALKMILLGANKQIQDADQLPFSDTGSGTWYHPYIATALSDGVVGGYPDGSFKPEKTVNKVEALKILLKTTNATPPTVTLESKSLFADTTIKNETLWYQPFVFYAVETNIVEPQTITTFGPEESLTRGQVAIMMYRLMYITENNLPRFETTQQGTASYYGSSLEGHRTSSGESFTNDDFSAASTQLAFHTFVEVINKNTGVSVIAKVNDRGPYAEGRVMDLSQSAFSAIENLSRGLANVTVKPLGTIPNLRKTYIAPDTFADPSQTPVQGITLDAKIPNIFFPNELYTITGTVASSETKTVTSVLTNKVTKVKSYITTNVINQHFSLPFLTTTIGDYQLNLVPDTTGIGYADLFVTKPEYFENKTTLPNNNAPLSPILSFQNGKTWVSVDPNGNNLFRLSFDQNGKTMVLITHQAKDIEIPYELFSSFTSGNVTLSIAGAKSSTNFTMDRYTDWTNNVTTTFEAVTHEYEIYKKEKLTIMPFPSIHNGSSLSLNGTTNVTLEPVMWYTLPSGKTASIQMDTRQTIPAGSSFHFTVPMTEHGTYIVEINDTNGEGVFNMPFYGPNTIPLLPNPRDIMKNLSSTSTIDLSTERIKMLSSINTERQRVGTPALSLSTTLNTLAQARSDDMARRNYFSHITPEGTSAETLATEYGITGSLGENLAKDNNAIIALYGLFRSSGHRNLLLSPDFTTIGIGISKANDGQLIVAQVFT